jgi:hypothetical protein
MELEGLSCYASRRWLTELLELASAYRRFISWFKMESGKPTLLSIEWIRWDTIVAEGMGSVSNSSIGRVDRNWVVAILGDWKKAIRQIQLPFVAVLFYTRENRAIGLRPKSPRQ